MEGIHIKSYKHDNTDHHHYHTQQQKQQEQEYWKHLRQVDNDHRSREAILRHLQPYIETERLRQHQRQVHQLQQQDRLQQQLLLQQEKRFAGELEWLQRHQQKQAAVIERQRQVALLRGGQKAQAGGYGEGEIQQDDRSGLVRQGAPVGLSVQEIWDRIPSTKNHIQPNETHQRRQQPQPHQQQTQKQPEVEERQHREKQELWELYKLRKQQEQETVERRQQLQQQQELEQALLSNKFLQQPSAKKDEVHSELIKLGSPQGQESKPNKVLPRYNRPLIPAPPNWVQSTTDINNKQKGIEDSDDDEEVDFEGEDHPEQYCNQQKINITGEVSAGSTRFTSLFQDASEVARDEEISSRMTTMLVSTRSRPMRWQGCI